MAEGTERKHYYHAEATALHGELELPLHHIIRPQAFAFLEPTGDYLSQNTGEFRAGNAVSYRSAYTQVAGNRDPKDGHGWSTLSTSVVEGLNLLDVLTADRVVAQVATEHPLVGYTPKISFLGTRFENLQIAGHPVELHHDLNILGDPPQGDAPYNQSPGFLERVRSQCSTLCGYEDLPREAYQRYERYNHLAAGTETPETVECSLVSRAAGSYPGKGFGHVIHVPNFGTIYLATVKVLHKPRHEEEPPTTTVDLTMVDAKLGCAASGNVFASRIKTNGPTKP